MPWGPVHGNCLSTGKFSPPTSFSPLQHQGVSPIQHPSLSFPTSLSFPSPLLLNSKTTQRSDAIFIIQINLEKKN